MADTQRLILHNARIHTMDPECPRAEALSLEGETVAAVGGSRDVLAGAARGTRIVDLEGAAVLPGFVDCHVHLLWFGLALERVDLVGAVRLEQALERVREASARIPEGQWILGRGWDHTVWPDARMPSREDLDRVAPRHPVALARKCGHAWWVNSLGLRQARIRADTPDPPGGSIDRLPGSSEPTGVVRETAIRLVSAVAERPSPEQSRRALLAAQEAAHRQGIVEVHAMEGPESFRACQELHAAGGLTLRVLMQIPEESLGAAASLGLRPGLGDSRLRIGGVKAFVDGSLGARTAWMIEAYQGEPGNCGIAVADAPHLRELLGQAQAAGFPLFVHAIGDRANRELLDTLEHARGAEAPGSSGGEPSFGLRHRIEHAQILSPEDIPRLARLGVIASMQPIHATQDMGIADRYLGERSRSAYAFRSLLDSGTRLAFGSDAPVESMSVLEGIHAAVTRRRADGSPGPEGWRPEQRISVEEAIAGYTVGAAYASGEEAMRGSLSPGKLADLVVLSRDITSCAPDELLHTDVLATVVGGELVWAAPGSPRGLRGGVR